MMFKKELCITRSMNAQDEIRMVLRQNNIKYSVETADRNFIASRIVANDASDIIYEIYVYKKDYDTVSYLIRNIKLL